VVLVVVDVVVTVVVVVLLVELSVLELICNALELAPLTNQAATPPKLRRSPPAKTAAARRLIAILLSGWDLRNVGGHDILAPAAAKRNRSKQNPYS